MLFFRKKNAYFYKLIKKFSDSKSYQYGDAFLNQTQMKSWNQYNEEALSLLITKKYKKKTNYI